jgi:hypothetical protein
MSHRRLSAILSHDVIGYGRMMQAEHLSGNAPEDAISQPAVTDPPRDNINKAIATGVFSVPTFVIYSEVFWDDDALPMLHAYLATPGLFETPEMRRISEMPIGVVRHRSSEV